MVVACLDVGIPFEVCNLFQQDYACSAVRHRTKIMFLALHLSQCAGPYLHALKHVAESMAVIEMVMLVHVTIASQVCTA